MNRRIRRARRFATMEVRLFQPDVEHLFAKRVQFNILRDYLIMQHKARLARKLKVPSYDGVLATPDDRYFRSLRLNTKTYKLLSCGRSNVRHIIKHNLTCSR